MSVTRLEGETKPTVEQMAVIPMVAFSRGLIPQLLFQPDSSHILAILPKARLVFLTKSFAICSVQLSWGAGPHEISPPSTLSAMLTASSRQSTRNNIEDRIKSYLHFRETGSAGIVYYYAPSWA
jgi:hypothetical protein